MVSLVQGKNAEIIKERRKQTEQTHSKMKRRKMKNTRGKSNNNNKHLWFYLLYKKSYFARKFNLKKPSS